MFKIKEELPFVDASGNSVFTVKASGIINVVGDYGIADTQTGEDINLDNDFPIFKDTWTIRDVDTSSKLAEITSRGTLVTLARNTDREIAPHRNSRGVWEKFT